MLSSQKVCWHYRQYIIMQYPGIYGPHYKTATGTVEGASCEPISHRRDERGDIPVFLCPFV